MISQSWVGCARHHCGADLPHKNLFSPSDTALGASPGMHYGCPCNWWLPTIQAAIRALALCQASLTLVIFLLVAPTLPIPILAFGLDAPGLAASPMPSDISPNYVCCPPHPRSRFWSGLLKICSSTFGAAATATHSPSYTATAASPDPVARLILGAGVSAHVVVLGQTLICCHTITIALLCAFFSLRSDSGELRVTLSTLGTPE